MPPSAPISMRKSCSSTDAGSTTSSVAFSGHLETGVWRALLRTIEFEGRELAHIDAEVVDCVGVDRMCVRQNGSVHAERRKCDDDRGLRFRCCWRHPSRGLGGYYCERDRQRNG